MWSIKRVLNLKSVLVAFYLLIKIYNITLSFAVDTEVFVFMIVV